MVDALINIVATIAIIAVGAFVIVFLTDLLLSILDGKKGIFFKNDKNDGRYGKELPNRPKMVNKNLDEPEILEEKQKAPAEQLSYTPVDIEKAKQEERLIKQTPNDDEEYDFSGFADSRFSQKNSNARQERIIETVPERELDDEDSIDKYIDEITKKSAAIVKNQNKQCVVVEKEVEEPEENEVKSNSEAELSKFRKELEEQKANYEAQLAKMKEQNELMVNEKAIADETKTQLEKTIDEQKATNEEKCKENLAPSETLKELNERLEVLEERLKDSKKLLKQNKREFSPLYRIHRSLENDTKKLRRKEANVAKKKVMLYGVNNYVDIDEEKAKSLNEELDLLEGLRLSVKHCNEVMEKNKDRYPILEQNNKILNSSINDIKSDIDSIQAKIDFYNNAVNDTDNAK